MTYNVDDRMIEHLRSKRQPYSDRISSSQALTPAIQMVIGQDAGDHGARVAVERHSVTGGRG